MMMDSASAIPGLETHSMLFLGNQLDMNMAMAENMALQQQLHSMVDEHEDDDVHVGFGRASTAPDTANITNTNSSSWYSTSTDETCFLPFDGSAISVSATAILDTAFTPFMGASAPESIQQSNLLTQRQRQGQSLHKRCIRVLKDIDRKRKEGQRLCVEANHQEQQLKISLQNKAAFHHMIAERNRRVKLKQHFQILHSLLPSNSKKDKYSILSNTSKYLSELLRKVKDLEHANKILQNNLETSKMNRVDEQDVDRTGPFLYHSEEIAIFPSKSGGREVNIRISVMIGSSVSGTADIVIQLLEKLKSMGFDCVSIKSAINSGSHKFQSQLICRHTREGERDWQDEDGAWENINWDSVATAMRGIF